MNDKQQELSTRIRPVPTYLSDRDQMTSQDHAAEYQPHEENSLQEYFKIVLTYRWLIVTVTCLVLACSFLYSFLATPLYTAQAKLKIGSYTPLLSGTSVEDLMRQQTREQDYLQTQVSLLSSLTLANKVMSESEIQQRLEEYLNRETGLFTVFKPFLNLLKKDRHEKGDALLGSYRYPLNVLNSYLDLVSITPIRRTSLVTISATTANPELSSQVANAHAQAFIELIREERQKSALENLVFLKSQADELSDKVALTEQNIAAYAEENAIVSLNKDENITVRRMSELSGMLTQATSARIKSETAYNEAQSGSALSSTSLDDETIERLRSSLKEAEAEYSMLGEKFKPSYPKMVQLSARIAMLKTNLSEQRNQALKALKARYDADLKTESELQKELEIQKSKAFELSRREVQYNIMKREYESLKDLHQSVLRQLKEAQVAAESQGSNIVLSDHAAIPLTHSSPKRLLNILVALLLGPLLGFGLGFTMEMLDNTLKTPEEVQNALRLPSLGIVPAFALEDLKKSRHTSEYLKLENDDVEPQTDRSNSVELTVQESSNLPSNSLSSDFVTLSAPLSIASEAFRAIRTGILLSSADSPPRVILVTSAKKGEGKTTLISNLAITLAQSSNGTILLDADLRRPNLHRQFGIDPALPGLVDYLTGQKDLASVVSRTPVENLSVIPSGSTPPNPSELIGSRKMAELLSLLSENYDYVLIDAPPVLPVTDAVMLSRVVDGVVLVVRGQDTQKQAARDAANRLKQIGGRILGVVLNDVNVRSGQYYYYYRDTYADYYREDSKRSLRRRRTA